MLNHKATITIADGLINLRQQLLDAIQKHDEVALHDVESALNAIEETLIALRVSQSALSPVDHMMSTVGDYFHGSTAKSTVSTVEEIQAAFHDDLGNLEK